MGSGLSSASAYASKSDKEIIALMMPVYYTHDAEITDDMLATAKASWNSIVQDKCATFVENTESEFSSGISMFYTYFYDRLFNVHPQCRSLFKMGIVAQGKFLVKMVTMIITSIKNREKFNSSMEALAMRHCERGIKAVEFGVVGDVLFWTIRKCLGDEAFTVEVQDAWQKIYSTAIQVIVPLCVNYERKGMVERSDSMVRATCSKTLTPSESIATTTENDTTCVRS